MKKFIILITIIIAIGFLNGIEHKYTRTVTVVDVQGQQVTVEDNNNYWSFNGEGYEIDQEIKVVMYDNHTSNITDDQIIKVKK